MIWEREQVKIFFFKKTKVKLEKAFVRASHRSWLVLTSLRSEAHGSHSRAFIPRRFYSSSSLFSNLNELLAIDTVPPR